MIEEHKDYWMPNALYDYLKFFSMIALPVMILGYWAIASIFGEQVNRAIGRTLVLMILFFGIVIYMAGRSYKKSESRFYGYINVIHDAVEGQKIYELELNVDPIDLDDQTEVLFKVISPAIVFPPGENRD